jgi:hypothetical protein
MRKWAARLGYAFGVLTIALPARAMAAVAGGTLPWDAPLNTLQTDLQGPVAHTITTAAIIGAGMAAPGLSRQSSRHSFPAPANQTSGERAVLVMSLTALACSVSGAP